MLTEKQVQAILYEENDDYEAVTDEEMDGKSRWSIMYSQVFKRVSDGTFWEISWSRGATEYQDDGPENVAMQEVELRAFTVYKYVAKVTEKNV